ncbi:serine--tRNA ligase [Actinospongicola halichondriae]|uniref:serine--tRNA ligase n=1 Tax=Actinospongicola halichondriae TaxID=3236844 RepID=UPI003D52E8D6
MLDLRRIRSEPDVVRAGLARRGADLAALDTVLDLDERLRTVTTERDDRRARVNAMSKQIGELFKAGEREQAEELKGESKALGDEEKELAAAADEIDGAIRDTLLRIPNLPSADAPDGASEDDNVVLRTHGPGPETFAEHQRVPHWDIGTELGIIDGERAVKISGSMFTMYRGWGARLLRAMIGHSLDSSADESLGAVWEEIRPPTLVKTETMIGTGHLPKFEEEAYHVERDDLWTIPTAEVPLTSMAAGEVLDHADLPMRFTAYTSCFRREAGAAGRDTRGLLRSHEFDKVELMAYADGEEMAIELQEEVLARSERLLQEFGLSYRILDLCAGDLGGSAARTWDIEAYAPGVGEWLEVSSVSWFSDYQARRAGVRWKQAGEKGTNICHTVNGSAMGWPRTVAAVLETHRQPDGSVAIPEVLQPRLGGATHIPAP